MHLTLLNVFNFRNIKQLSFTPSRHINYVYGDNGAGKTSLLEAIHYLSTGKSFKTHVVRRVIKDDEDSLILHAKCNDNLEPTSLGLQRYSDGTTSIKINNQQASLSSLAQTFPTLLIPTNSQSFFSDGPKQRRQFLDKSVFHVKHGFIKAWKNYNIALQQRNAALKTRSTRAEIHSWDNLLIEFGKIIHENRIEILEKSRNIIIETLASIIPELENIQFRYKQGWMDGVDLGESLKKDIDRDLQTSYTHSGPHRADIEITWNGKTAQHYLSQGQQKLIAYAFHLSQGETIKQLTNKDCVYLIDDLSSELDEIKQKRVITLLIKSKHQCIITGTQSHNTALDGEPTKKMFHMKHGELA